MRLRWLLFAAGIGGAVVFVLLVAHRVQSNTSSRYEWDIQSVGTRAADQAPLNSVALQTKTTGYYVGEYVGTCRAINETSSDLLPGELSAIVCSWMDNAVEIGVFDGSPGKDIREIEHSKGSRDPFQARVLLPLNTNE
ncbi:hypothetical protein QNJ95_37385 [Bradyrhizobium elkanii]|uniref:hypothetical protein n=1 Tax=Bradyrhizobium elkanii TaxID=29448 RepID=UPI002711EE5D|nr:hypothetical protein [Bradyrhizobium elkanii]WLA38551.1 hypothetical protein QNJ95_37385 [Bradyrhizobium elkanii]